MIHHKWERCCEGRCAFENPPLVNWTLRDANRTGFPMKCRSGDRPNSSWLNRCVQRLVHPLRERLVRSDSQRLVRVQEQQNSENQTTPHRSARGGLLRCTSGQLTLKREENRIARHL